MPAKKSALAVEDSIIKAAKRYAKEHNTSVSAIFSNVINAVSSQDSDFKILVNSALKSVAGEAVELINNSYCPVLSKLCVMLNERS